MKLYIEGASDSDREGTETDSQSGDRQGQRGGGKRREAKREADRQSRDGRKRDEHTEREGIRGWGWGQTYMQKGDRGRGKRGSERELEGDV